MYLTNFTISLRSLTRFWVCLCLNNNCVKSVRVRSYSGPYFLLSTSQTSENAQTLVLDRVLNIPLFLIFEYTSVSVSEYTFLYHLKTSKKLMVSWYFRGVDKGCLGNIWVKEDNNALMTLKIFQDRPLRYEISYNMETEIELIINL